MVVGDDIIAQASKVALSDEESEGQSEDTPVDSGNGTGQQEGAGDVDGGSSKQQKKKKKKKKTAAQKRAAAANASKGEGKQDAPPVVLKISRNKHMKYISSYHGPWLQLPHEVLDQLLAVNCAPDNGVPLRALLDHRSHAAALRQRYKALPADGSASSPTDSTFTASDSIEDSQGRNLPPPIDPAVFRGVTAIRRLVDDASDLAVRAASGMSAAALGALNPNGLNTNALGLEQNSSGRNAAMSPIRQHRLRKLAVAKLAEAYRIDEIAASVAVMQGATGLDDLAAKVLKNDPDCVDAQYVQFFHEKIPSRTLAVSTDTSLLDQLILKDPKRLEFYRTRGTVHGYKQDYASAIRNFTTALTQAKATRKARDHHAHHHNESRQRKKGKGKSSTKKGINEDRPAESGSHAARDEAMAASVGKEPGDDIERQLLFHRGMAYFHSACQLIEETVLDIENVDYPQGGLSNEGGELTLRNIGIVLKDELAGLYGSADKQKQERYRSTLSDTAVKDRVNVYLRRSIRDMERFLAYFSVWEAPPGTTIDDDKRFANPRSTERPLTFRGRRLIHHRSLSGRNRYSDPRVKDLNRHDEGTKGETPLLSTYHPLIIEAHFAILVCHLLLGDFAALVPLHYRVVRIMEHLEGYPAFLPARSLNQSEYAELLERIASTWLARREASGISAPEGTEEDVVLEGDLKSLHHLLSFFTEDFADAIVTAAETANQEAQAKEDSAKKTLSITDAATANANKGSWAEQRERAEAERRKIDPSYAVYNTARAEVALAWMTAVVLPEKEEEERKGHAKGKASTEGRGHRHAGSFVIADDDEEL